MSTNNPNDIYDEISELIEKEDGSSRILQGIQYFYHNHDQSLLENVALITQFDLTEQKKILQALAGEMVNRDYCQFVATGAWGEGSAELKQILCCKK